MKKVLIFILLMIVLVGCGKKEEKIISIYCEQDFELNLPEVYDLYEDDKYLYQMEYVEAHVTYNGEQLTFKDALEQNVVSIDELVAECHHLHKVEKSTD